MWLRVAMFATGLAWCAASFGCAGASRSSASPPFTSPADAPDAYPGTYQQCQTPATKLTVRVAVTEPLADLYPDILASIPDAFKPLTESLAAAGLMQPELVVGPVVNGTEASDTGRELQRLKDPADGNWDTLAVRDTDVVMLAVLNGGNEQYGLADIGARRDNAYAVVTRAGMLNPDMMSLAHEFGHLAGMRHEVADDPLETPVPAAHAFVTDGFRTLMAAACRGCQRQPFWADPNTPLPSGGGQMGIAGETEQVTHLARTLPYLASFHCP
jgi:hypothetical protein